MSLKLTVVSFRSQPVINMNAVFISNGGGVGRSEDNALVLPDKEFTFDNKRPVTTLAHLIEDYKNNTTEEDSTHFEEVIALHDFKHDAFVQSKEDLIKRTNLNIENRAVHHHVFNLDLVKELLVYCDFEMVHQQTYPPFHLVSVAEKK